MGFKALFRMFALSILLPHFDNFGYIGRHRKLGYTGKPNMPGQT